MIASKVSAQLQSNHIVMTEVVSSASNWVKAVVTRDKKLIHLVPQTSVSLFCVVSWYPFHYGHVGPTAAAKDKEVQCTRPTFSETICGLAGGQGNYGRCP